MVKYTCIIMEDEPLALEKTQSFVAKVPSLKLVQSFENALQGLQFLKENKVDILFLDIEMDELSGIELIESTSIDSQIIITTAYPDYALKGYELNVVDYLLKPFTFQRFLQAVNKAEGNIGSAQQPALDYFFIKTGHRLEKVLFDDLLFIEGMREYRKLYTKKGTIMTLQTLAELEELLPTQQVCRIHKSYMVAIKSIENIEKSRVKISERLLPISASYKEHFFKAINQTA